MKSTDLLCPICGHEMVISMFGNDQVVTCSNPECIGSTTEGVSSIQLLPYVLGDPIRLDTQDNLYLVFAYLDYVRNTSISEVPVYASKCYLDLGVTLQDMLISEIQRINDVIGHYICNCCGESHGNLNMLVSDGGYLHIINSGVTSCNCKFDFYVTDVDIDTPRQGSEMFVRHMERANRIAFLIALAMYPIGNLFRYKRIDEEMFSESETKVNIRYIDREGKKITDTLHEGFKSIDFK